MKRQYNGVYMKAHKILPGAKTLARILDISPEAKRRLKWLNWYFAHGKKFQINLPPLWNIINLVNKRKEKSVRDVVDQNKYLTTPRKVSNMLVNVAWEREEKK